MRAALKSVPGVRDANVDFDKELAKVSYDPKRVTIKQMVAALGKMGFKGRTTDGEKRTRGVELPPTPKE